MSLVTFLLVNKIKREKQNDDKRGLFNIIANRTAKSILRDNEADIIEKEHKNETMV